MGGEGDFADTQKEMCVVIKIRDLMSFGYIVPKNVFAGSKLLLCVDRLI